MAEERIIFTLRVMREYFIFCTIYIFTIKCIFHVIFITHLYFLSTKFPVNSFLLFSSFISSIIFSGLRNIKLSCTFGKIRTSIILLFRFNIGPNLICQLILIFGVQSLNYSKNKFEFLNTIRSIAPM